MIIFYEQKIKYGEHNFLEFCNYTLVCHYISVTFNNNMNENLTDFGQQHDTQK